MRLPRTPVLLALLLPGVLAVPMVPAQAAGPAASPAPVSPTASPAAAAAREPVPPKVSEVPVSGIDAAAGRQLAPSLRADSGGRSTVVLTAPQATASFTMVAVTWDHGSSGPGVEAQVRTRTATGWSSWASLGGAADEAPDPGSADLAGPVRDGTSPLFTETSDGVQARVTAAPGETPTGVRLSLIDPGTSPADAVAATPAAAPLADAPSATGAAPLADAPSATGGALRTGPRPAIRSRAAWGADESIRKGSPSYASGIRAVTVHHTDSSNNYTPTQVPALMRGFYAYHVESRGWSDIGYNVLVDRFGTAWEGRYGGLDRAVVGSHAGGFNTGTAGISMIGNFETVPPTSAQLETVAQVAAWKLAGVDALATVRLTSGGSTRYPTAGTVVTLPTVFGHRQVSLTQCNGNRGYESLPKLRQRIAALQRGSTPAPTPKPTPEPTPEPTPPPAPVPGGLQMSLPTQVAAGQRAALVVRGGKPGAAVEVFFRSRDESVASLRRNAALDASGEYRTDFPVDLDWTVQAFSGTTATPPMTVRRNPPLPAAPTAAASLSITGPMTVPAGGRALLTATGTPGTDVTVWFRPEGQKTFGLGRTGRLDASGYYVTSYTAGTAHEYVVRSAQTASTPARTGLGPVPDGLHVYAPTSMPAGATVPVVVQGTPGTPVWMWFARPGEALNRRRDAVLAADGTYRTSFVANAVYTVLATSGSRSSNSATTNLTGQAGSTGALAAALRMSVPLSADAGGTATAELSGRPGAGAELWTRRRSERTFTRTQVGVVASGGTWRVAVPTVDDTEMWFTSGLASSRVATTLVRPVLTAPGAAPLGTTVRLSGRARPGDVVVLERRRYGATSYTGTTVRADASGAYTASFVADDAYDYRPAAAGRVGEVHRVLVAASLSAMDRTGESVRVTGTARPGASVELLSRQQAPTFGVATRRLRPWTPMRLAATTTADAAGRFTATLPMRQGLALVARADGTQSPVRTGPAPR